jgi:16S rRNA C1402 (ribose-2'-O) methylase RsmI
VIPIKNINILFAMPSSAPVDKAVVAIDLTNLHQQLLLGNIQPVQKWFLKMPSVSN